MGKKRKPPVVGANRNNPYKKSSREVGMKVPTPPKTIKVLAEEILPKTWVLIIVVSLIPIINLIAFAAWKNKNNYATNPNVRTYAKAGLIVYPILYLLIGVVVVLLKFVFHLF